MRVERCGAVNPCGNSLKRCADLAEEALAPVHVYIWRYPIKIPLVELMLVKIAVFLYPVAAHI